MSEYTVNTLANGVRLVTVPMPQLHAAELVCYLAVGGRNEPPELSGISHFLEHMIFRGTDEYDDSTALERAFEAIGGAVNASTDAENIIEIVVNDLEFLGSFYRAVLNIKGNGGSELLADLSINLVRDMGVKEGMTMNVALPADRLRVYSGDNINE